MVERDARCIDAHAHLGGLAFEWDEAHELCRTPLWLNPADNHGAPELLGEIAVGASWRHSR